MHVDIFWRTQAEQLSLGCLAKRDDAVSSDGADSSQVMVFVNKSLPASILPGRYADGRSRRALHNTIPEQHGTLDTAKGGSAVPSSLVLGGECGTSVRQ